MRFIPIFLFAFLLFSCRKGEFTTRPQLRYRSVNSRTISGPQELRIKFDLTDKEGDYTTFLGVKKVVPGCPNSGFIDSTFFSIPQDFLDSKQKDGELVIILNENNRKDNQCSIPGTNPPVAKPDTATFSFWTRDKAGNVSDTARTETIIILN